jgi:hypothetical protein
MACYRSESGSSCGFGLLDTLAIVATIRRLPTTAAHGLETLDNGEPFA